MKKIHLLVWDAFGDKPRNGRILQVDHINNIKTDNRIENLQLLNNRENSSKGKMQKLKTSRFTGVNWHKASKNWMSRIQINGKNNLLGFFSTEEEAHQAYQNALNKLLKT